MSDSDGGFEIKIQKTPREGEGGWSFVSSRASGVWLQEIRCQEQHVAWLEFRIQKLVLRPHEARRPHTQTSAAWALAVRGGHRLFVAVEGETCGFSTWRIPTISPPKTGNNNTPPMHPELRPACRRMGCGEGPEFWKNSWPQKVQIKPLCGIAANLLGERCRS